MTGFARTEGIAEGASWVWELRSVNGRGLELRLKLPPGFDRIEPALREAAGKSLRRGNVQATLTVRQEEAARLVADRQALDQALALALDLQARIPGGPAPRAEALLGLPGVLRPARPDEADEDRTQTIDAALIAGFRHALGLLASARREEGERLKAGLDGLLAEIEALRVEAEAVSADQPAAQQTRLLDTVRTLLRDVPALPEERIAQEVALLAARSDVREELERLRSHGEAGHALLREGAGIGRRFDFLVQEFNREANTLCSKSASAALTATGLRLKAAIEQLREQTQNIE
ncbi:MAG: YicC family protein [Acetobacteraceae bacterium]|nr:YicC family protein [Acetobacteraceae bacterium]